MDLDQVIKTDREYYMNTFGKRTPVMFERGEGVYLFDQNGKRYMDLLGGIAVSVLGHAHPRLTEAICSQAGKLLHTSSLYYIRPQAELAEKLCTLSGTGKAFFCNSGAEANEGAIKLARAFSRQEGHENRYEIVTLKDSFHGRTLATLSATGQEKYHAKFHPINTGFKYVIKGDIEALKQTVTGSTCAVMLELIQGESGVWPLDKGYVIAVQRLCEEKGLLLILDEVQTGIGRTGTMFGFQQYDIEPDIVTLAKGLGGGVPIGAFLAKDAVASAFHPGDHGSTFGGNHLATSAALSVVGTIIDEGLLENCRDTGSFALESLKAIRGNIIEVRGLGLMIGIEFDSDIAVEVKDRLLELGYVVGSVGKRIIRILPPLIIQKQHISEFVSVLKEMPELKAV